MIFRSRDMREIENVAIIIMACLVCRKPYERFSLYIKELLI